MKLLAAGLFCFALGMPPFWHFVAPEAVIPSQAEQSLPAAEIDDAAVASDCEFVMAPNTRIIAKGPLETMVITSGKGLRRSYACPGQNRTVQMAPRQTRTMGSKGLYFPVVGKPWHSDAYMEESRQNFPSLVAAMEWLSSQARCQYKIFRNDGLCVWWEFDPARKALSVEVVQILINNKKPTSLPRADDSRIRYEKVALASAPAL